MKFSKNIKTRRIEKNMTQESLSQLLNVSRVSISNWETGKNYPDFGLLVKISTVLDLSLDTLIKDDYEMIEHVKKEEKKNIRRKKTLYIIIPFLILLLVWFSINVLNINVVELSKEDISKVKMVENTLIVETRLNGLEAIAGWVLDSGENDTTLIVSKSVSLSNVFKKNKSNIIEIPLKEESNLKEIIFNGETIDIKQK